MSFTYNKFLRPLTISDTSIQILDNSGVIVYTINPFSISSPMISNNLLKVNFKNGKLITINFSSTNEAKLALSRLQAQIDELLNRTPLIIDKQIKNYIDSQISGNNELSEILRNGRDVDSIGIINDSESNESIDFNSRTLHNSNGDGVLSWSASAGLVYLNDYSSNFITQSVVDKGYVDFGTSSIWTYIYYNEKTYSSGLQVIGNTVSLGGTMTNTYY